MTLLNVLLTLVDVATIVAGAAALAAADRALHRAKAGGRNRVEGEGA
jgi:PleD family two-component response regulator